MDFITLQNLIQNGIKNDVFEINADVFENTVLRDIIISVYNGKISLNQTTLTVLDNRLILNGRHTIPLLDEILVNAALEFYIVNEQPNCTVGIILSNDIVPDSVKNTFELIFEIFHCSYSISDSGLIISSISEVNLPQNISHLPGVPKVIQKGFYFFSTLNCSGPVFDLLEGIFGDILPLNLKKEIVTESLNSEIIEVAVRMALPAIGPISFADTRIVLQKEAFTLVNDIFLDIGQEILHMKGGGAILPDNSFNFLFKLEGVQKDGQAETTTKEWIDPLGFTGLTIKEFGANIAVETRGTIFGMFGEISIGQDGETDRIILGVAGEILNGNTPQALSATIRSQTPSSNGVSLTKIIEGLSKIPIGDFPILSEIRVRHFEVYIVLDPNGYQHPIKKVTYFGLSLSSSITLFGLSLDIDLQLIPDEGIKAKGEIGQINLGGVLIISNATNNGGPILQIDTTQINQELGYVYFSCKVSLFGISQTMVVKATQESFAMFLDYSVRGLGNFRLNCNLINNQEFKGNAEINFDFADRTIPISIGGQQIGSLSLGTHIRGTIEVNLTGQEFFLSISANASLLGLPEFVVQLNVTEAISDFSNIPEQIYHELLNNSQQALNTPLTNPAILLQWVNSGIVNITRETGDVLRNIYNKSEAEAAQLLKDAHFSASQTAGILVNNYQTIGGQVGSILNSVGYQAKENVEALYQGLNLSPDQVFETVIRLGYPHSDLAIAFHEGLNWNGDQIVAKYQDMRIDSAHSLGESLQALGWNPLQISQKLNEVGKHCVEVGMFLRNSFSLNEVNTTNVLKQVYTKVEDIVDTLKHLWGITDELDVAKILKRENFSLENISIGLKKCIFYKYLGSHYPLPEQAKDIIKALSRIDYNLKEVTVGMGYIYKFTQETLAAIYNYMRIDPKEIVDVAKVIWEWTAEKIGTVLAKLHIETNKILDALSHTGFSGEDIQRASQKIVNVVSGIDVTAISVNNITDRIRF